MSGLIGKKVGMTQVYDEFGELKGVTVIEVEPNVITQLKTEESDGYTAVQLAAFDRKEKNTSNALKGHFGKAGVTAKKVVTEIRDYTPEGLAIGDSIAVGDVFSEGTKVDVVGATKGKGFQGVVKRHGFGGVGGRTHGQHNRERAPGAIGQASYPARVFKGIKMAGQQGNVRSKTKRLKVIKVIAESNLLLVQGAVPGPNGSYVTVYNA